MPLTRDEARHLLGQVLADFWNQEHRPVLGSHLKATMQAAAARGGAEFDEKSLGFANFAAFVQAQADLAAVKIRVGTDMLVVPVEHRGTLFERPEQRTPRIRPEIWEAFVTFPVPNRIRGYDPVEDRIVVLPVGNTTPGLVPIEPISRQTQIEWRREFIDSLGPSSPLAHLRGRIDGPSGLYEFAKAVRSDSSLNRRWGEMRFQRVYDIIRAWASATGLPETRWLDLREVAEDQRKRLYAALDKIPLEYLMDLKIPLKWLIDREPKP